jgi:hypothetical protein
VPKGLIHAASNGSGDHSGSTHLFRGEHYVRFDWRRYHAAAGYPQTLALWRLPEPFRSGVDAAIEGREAYVGSTDFFKNGSIQGQSLRPVRAGVRHDRSGS